MVSTAKTSWPRPSAAKEERHFAPPKRAARAAARRELARELKDATQSGDNDEVVALLQLSYPDRSPVFGALDIGCAASLKAVLEHGADPNEEFEGHSPLAACICAFAAPIGLFASGGRSVARFSGEEADVVRALLTANAAPTALELRQACHMKNPAIGKLLLDFGCAVEESAMETSLLAVAAKFCPGLVFPLFLRGANPFEVGPEGLPPIAINPEAFREVRWRLIRVLVLVRREVCPAMNNDVLSVIMAFYLGQLADPEKSCTWRGSEKGTVGGSEPAYASALESFFLASCHGEDPFGSLVPVPASLWKRP
jgi:hypothetical protein